VFTIIFLNWITLILLFYIISSIVVPIEVYNGLPSVFLTGLFKVAIAGSLFMSWLYIWNLCVKIYFIRKCLKDNRLK
jgi:hypothetical protein